MVRLIIAFLVCCLATPGWTQTQPSPPAVTKPAVKKSAPKAKAAQKPPQATESGPCRIGVIAMIGEKISVQKVGFTVFGNELNEVVTTGWGLDDLVVARVRTAAGGSGVRRVTYAKDAFVGVRLPGLFGSTSAELKNVFQQVTAGLSCERYVLVTPIASRFSGTNQSVSGIGLVHWNALPNRAYIFALTHIYVFDGRSFEMSKHGAASTNEESLISRALIMEPIRGPHRQFDEALFPATPSDAINDPKFRDDTRALLATSLDRTLPDLLQPGR